MIDALVGLFIFTLLTMFVFRFFARESTTSQEVDDAQESAVRTRTRLQWTIAAAFALTIVPFDLLVYPMELYHTFVHETAHAAVIVLGGGTLPTVRVRADLSGLTYSGEAAGALVSSAGYLGTAFLGSLLLAACGRVSSVRPALIACATSTLVATVFFLEWARNDILRDAPLMADVIGLGLATFRRLASARDLLTPVVGLSASGTLMALAVGPPRRARFGLTVLAVFLCALSLADVPEIVLDPVGIPDLRNTAASVGISVSACAWIWAVLILGMTISGLALYLRQSDAVKVSALSMAPA